MNIKKLAEEKANYQVLPIPLTINGAWLYHNIGNSIYIWISMYSNRVIAPEEGNEFNNYTELLYQKGIDGLLKTTNFKTKKTIKKHINNLEKEGVIKQIKENLWSVGVMNDNGDEISYLELICHKKFYEEKMENDNE